MKLLRPDLFDLNPRRKIHSKRIGEGGHHLVIIDDLFQHPRDISNLFNELPYSDDANIREGAPTYRCSMLFPTRRLIYQELMTLHHKVYGGIKSMEENGTAFDQYWDQSSIIDIKSCPPHVDLTPRSSYAFVIYMNERNIHGGTQFIRHTINGRESVRSKEQQDINEVFNQDTTIRFSTPWDYEPLEWQRYHLAPMKFNRLISYRNNILHSMYTNGSFYRNTPRKTIVSNF
tara:strand:- start:703 stop:1395 length:693 start_codon:yes stop_codon:yes gene_type:complete